MQYVVKPSKNDLMHFGILGMKWGVRRYQNPDGSLTAAGRARYGSYIQKKEQKAIKDTYKLRRENGGSYLFKSARKSTGKNFDKADKEFENKVLSDKKYKELSKNAFDAEKKRLMAEKGHNRDDYDYERLINTKEYDDLWKASKDATKKKNDYVKKLAKQYMDTIKDAKIKDLNITDNIELAKKYLSGDFNNKYVWDMNLEYNDDNFYESWVDKERFK